MGYGSQELDSFVAFDPQLFNVWDERLFWVKSNAQEFVLLGYGYFRAI